MKYKKLELRNIKMNRNLKFNIQNFRKELKILSLFSLFCFLQNCYSFTGSSLSPETKTIQIKNFPNNTAYNPDLSQNFTVDLQNRFLQRTTLKGTDSNPHILIEGEITGYDLTPTTISSSTTTNTGTILQAAENKLTIVVKVHYENSIETEKSFDRTYSDEATFSSDLGINDIEAAEVKVVTDRIINKIFNDVVADW